MTTIKSYTDINQSKKLAEILPIESADMYYIKREINDTFIETPIVKPIGDGLKSLPCWSLSTLMNIIEIGKVEICFNCNNNKYWVDVHFETLGSFCQDHELYDSKIDALIAMIKKLKSRNLL